MSSCRVEGAMVDVLREGRLTAVTWYLANNANDAALVTTRSYGRFVREVLEEQAVKALGYCGNWRPGTVLHHYFRDHPVTDDKYSQRYVHRDSEFARELYRLGLADRILDVTNLAGDADPSKNWIQLYTVFQIRVMLESYIGEWPNFIKNMVYFQELPFVNGDVEFVRAKTPPRKKAGVVGGVLF